jgi:F0F1-type ATP synthase assembly protein I
MEQELPKDEFERTGDRSAEDLSQPVGIDAEIPAPVELEPPAAEDEARDSEDMRPYAESPTASLEVVDPYTAAPPSLGFDEPQVDQFRADTGSDPAWQETVPFQDPFVPIPYTPATTDETIRRSGLAWSAGVAFFGSVAFTLFLGWLADLLLGTSPWGIVGGIILGSIIGFLQFFRITSQIFPSKASGPVETTLMAREDDDQP